MRVLKVNKENTKNILSDLLKRSPNNYDQYAGTVQGILDEIKEKGDEALFAYTEKFDKCKRTTSLPVLQAKQKKKSKQLMKK